MLNCFINTQLWSWYLESNDNVVLSSADSFRNIHIYILDTYRRNDNDRRRKTSLTKYVPLTFFVRVR